MNTDSEWLLVMLVDERRQLLRVYIPWANRAAKNAHFLMNTIYEEEFETPLEELRARLNIEVAPPFPSTAIA